MELNADLAGTKLRPGKLLLIQVDGGGIKQMTCAASFAVFVFSGLNRKKNSS